MKKRIIAVIFLGLSAWFLFSSQIHDGYWRQTSSTAGDCAGCTVYIEHHSPDIIMIKASNGWLGYFYYDSDNDEYKGFLQLTDEPIPGLENWKGHLFTAVLVKDRQTLTLNAKSDEIAFIATFRMME